ncbi:MAG TPA: hypothetical protein VJT31_34935 [Rugosimonospora sp.]|nr:hypothetical protein [Rugosimonospora sp.]
MPSTITDVATIARTRAFYEALAHGCDSDVEQIEVALAYLAELQLDEQTLDGFQSAQEDARGAAARCRSVLAVLDARQALLEGGGQRHPGRGQDRLLPGRDGHRPRRGKRDHHADTPAGHRRHLRRGGVGA